MIFFRDFFRKDRESIAIAVLADDAAERAHFGPRRLESLSDLIVALRHWALIAEGKAAGVKLSDEEWKSLAALLRACETRFKNIM